MDEVIIVERKRDGIVVVTLNRPGRHNAINQDLSDSLAAIFRDLNRDSSVNVVILTGAGKSFCAGIDLTNPVNAVQQSSDSPSDMLVNPVRAIEEFTRPVIGAINGAAMTGGFEIALACDFLIGSTSARYFKAR
jgi:enoyl-CoA hydratase